MTTRRRLLTCSIAVVTAPLLPTPPAGASTTGDQALFAMAARRQSLNAIADAPHPELTEPETDAPIGRCVDEAAEIESRMVGYRAVTFPGAALKLHIAHEIEPHSIAARSIGGRLELSAPADLERLAGSAST